MYEIELIYDEEDLTKKVDARLVGIYNTYG